MQRGGEEGRKWSEVKRKREIFHVSVEIADKNTFYHRNICSPLLSLFDLRPVEIARQLTIMEFKRFSAIKMSELFGQKWSAEKHKAQNVINMINAFNLFWLPCI